MLQAIDGKTGRLVVPALLTAGERERWKREKTFSCPDCRQSVVFKNGTTITPHFAHHVTASCSLQDGGEGEYHTKGKLQLYQWLKSQHIKVELEAYLPEIQQRPDLLVTIKAKRIALEYQCAAISPAVFQKRTNQYLAAGITPIWIQGGNRQRRAGPAALLLTANDKFFLHQYRSDYTPLLYYYCSNTRKISFFHHILFTGHRKNYGKLHYVHLNSLSFKNLFKWKQQKQVLMYPAWLEERKRMRSAIPSVHQHKARKWYAWLYENGSHPSILPSLAGLPVKSQYKLSEPPVIWQSELLFRYLLTLHPGQCISLVSCRKVLAASFIFPHFFPLIQDEACPVEEYFHLLVKAGFFVKKEEFIYQKRKEIILPVNMEAAVQADLQLYRKLTDQEVLRF